MYLRDLDLARGLGTLVPMTPASYAESSFLDNRIKRSSEVVYDLPLDVLLRMSPWFAADRRAVHYVFHIGHCGSTLLSRLIGGLPGFFSLREPTPLRALTEHAEPGHPTPANWNAALAMVLGLLSRVFDSQETAVIKPSSFCNRLIPSLLEWHPDCRGILLYIDLPAYLATMTKQTNRRETKFAMATYHLQEVRHLLDDRRFIVESLPELRVAALVWLVNMANFLTTIENPALRKRVSVVRFDDLLGDPNRILSECGAFLGKNFPAREINRVASDPSVIKTYSKGDRHGYGAPERDAELRQAQEVYGAEIGDAIDWARMISSRHPAFETAIADFGGL